MGGETKRQTATQTDKETEKEEKKVKARVVLNRKCSHGAKQPEVARRKVGNYFQSPPPLLFIVTIAARIMSLMMMITNILSKTRKKLNGRRPIYVQNSLSLD